MESRAGTEEVKQSFCASYLVCKKALLSDQIHPGTFRNEVVGVPKLRWLARLHFTPVPAHLVSIIVIMNKVRVRHSLTHRVCYSLNTDR